MHSSSCVRTVILLYDCVYFVPGNGIFYFKKRDADVEENSICSVFTLVIRRESYYLLKTSFQCTHLFLLQKNFTSKRPSRYYYTRAKKTTNDSLSLQPRF